MSAAKQTVHANIDCVSLAKIAHVGVRRAALFLGLGLNGINQPGFSDYELHKLPAGSNPAVIVPDIIARGAPDDAIARFKDQFSIWVTGCGLREMLEHYGLMLDRIHECCLWVARSRGCLSGEPPKLMASFERHGIKGKHATLRETFQIVPEFAAHVDTFYAARNALTHGLGIVRPVDATEGTLQLRWVALEIHGHGEETGSVVPMRKMFGVATTEPMRIRVDRVKRELSFKVGETLALSAQNLYEICLFMAAQVIPKTMAAFVEFLRAHEVEVATA
jgi:hypothetical protein